MGDGTGPHGRRGLAPEGSDLTIVAHGPMVDYIFEAAERLAGEGIADEVIDLPIRPGADRPCDAGLAT